MCRAGLKAHFIHSHCPRNPRNLSPRSPHTTLPVTSDLYAEPQTSTPCPHGSPDFRSCGSAHRWSLLVQHVGVRTRALPREF